MFVTLLSVFCSTWNEIMPYNMRRPTQSPVLLDYMSALKVDCVLIHLINGYLDIIYPPFTLVGRRYANYNINSYLYGQRITATSYCSFPRASFLLASFAASASCNGSSSEAG